MATKKPKAPASAELKVGRVVFYTGKNDRAVLVTPTPAHAATKKGYKWTVQFSRFYKWKGETKFGPYTVKSGARHRVKEFSSRRYTTESGAVKAIADYLGPPPYERWVERANRLVRVEPTAKKAPAKKAPAKKKRAASSTNGNGRGYLIETCRIEPKTYKTLEAARKAAKGAPIRDNASGEFVLSPAPPKKKKR